MTAQSNHRQSSTAVFVWTDECEAVALRAAAGYFFPCSDHGDVVQEARYGVWKALRDWTPERGPFAPFAARRAKCQVIDALRLASTARNRPLNEAVSLDAPVGGDDGSVSFGDLVIREDGDPVYVVIALDEARRLLEQIAFLTPWQRECIVRVLVAGEPYKAVGAQKSVDNAIWLGRKKIRKGLADVA